MVFGSQAVSDLYMFHDGVYGSQGLCTSNSYFTVKNIWCVGKKLWDSRVGYSITAV